jgi:hypothetical protein
MDRLVHFFPPAAPEMGRFSTIYKVPIAPPPALFCEPSRPMIVHNDPCATLILALIYTVVACLLPAAICIPPITTDCEESWSFFVSLFFSCHHFMFFQFAFPSLPPLATPTSLSLSFSLCTQRCMAEAFTRLSSRYAVRRTLYMVSGL